MIERTRLQYDYPPEEIEAAIKRALNISYFKTQEGFNHSLATVGKAETKTLAFTENENIEKGILQAVKSRASDTIGNGGSTGPIIYDNDKGLHELQNNAVRMALTHGVSIITGGPGTGKTTICTKIGERLKNVLGVAIAARAARNFTDKTQIDSMTIAAYLHRAREGHTPCPDTLIIDEASMVGSKDMAAILQYSAGAGTERLIMVGDKDQLPPIDWGCPFADLIEANILPVTKLQKIYRTAEGGGIALLASHVRDRALLQAYYQDVVFSNVDETSIAERAIAEYAHLLRRGLQCEDIGLITPYVADHYLYAADKLNAMVRKLRGLDPDRPTVGDLVIGTKNHRKPYDAHEFMNGQRGIVAKPGDCTLAIQFEGEEQPEYFDASELELNGLPKYVSYGYATTIHKSQGGEYAHVIAIVPKNIAYTFGKPAIYTAFTRARQSLTIMGALDWLPGYYRAPRKAEIYST